MDGPLSSASGGLNGERGGICVIGGGCGARGSAGSAGVPFGRPRTASDRETSTFVGRSTSAIMPRSGPGRSSTLTLWRCARRATTTRPIMRETATSTIGGVERRSLSSASWSAETPMPRSSTKSTARSPTRRASTSTTRIRRRERGRVVEQFGDEVDQVVDRVRGDLEITVDHAELDPGVVLDLGLGRAEHVDQRCRLALDAGRVGTGEDEQVFVVAAHSGGEVVELEQLGQAVRVLLAAFELVEVADQPVDQDLRAAGQVDEHRGDRGPQCGLLGGGTDGLQVDGVERLGHLPEFVAAPDRQRLGDLQRDLVRAERWTTGPGRAVGPPPAAGRSGRR